MSKKQRLATKDSTESELVALSDFVAKVEFTQGYVRARGYRLEEPIVFNDNTSTITIINKLDDKPLRNRHLTARRGILREFFCEDKLGHLKYKNTKDMVADVMTKPLLGKSFERFAMIIMGWHEFPLITP